jgi:alpha-tubulin suppressor-like RCC1 family protein
MVPGVKGAVAIAGGGDGLCVANAQGVAQCRDWKHGPLSPAWPKVRRVVVTTGNVYKGRCALLQDGAVDCAGQRFTDDAEFSQLIEGMRDLRVLALGANHGCAIRADGKVVCVGSDVDGQLGAGRLLASATPMLVE